MYNKKLEKLLSNFKYAKLCKCPNYIKIPVNELSITEESMILFNSIVALLRKDKSYTVCERTPSGGIKVKPLLEMFPSWSYVYDEHKAEILILDEKMYRITFGCHTKKIGVSGRHAFQAFKKYAEKDGINMTQYEVSKEEGLAIKETIPNPSIFLAPSVSLSITSQDVVNKELKETHHLDINSAYPAGVCKEYPEFRKLLGHLYEHRKSTAKTTRHIEGNVVEMTKGEWYKAVMNLSIGFCQSKYCGYKYAKIAKAALDFTRQKIDRMVEIIVALGRIPIATNTDGIWYLGPIITNQDLSIYKGERISGELGDWKHDHKHCIVRFKSVGAYEFYEDCIFDKNKNPTYKGKYSAVVRGLTTLDMVKPRESWQWGDIYQPDCKVILFNINEDGIIEKGEVSLD